MDNRIQKQKHPTKKKKKKTARRPALCGWSLADVLFLSLVWGRLSFVLLYLPAWGKKKQTSHLSRYVDAFLSRTQLVGSMSGHEGGERFVTFKKRKERKKKNIGLFLKGLASRAVDPTTTPVCRRGIGRKMLRDYTASSPIYILIPISKT